MRLHAFELKNVPPIIEFSVHDLADVIVLAGPNGVGKTRLVQALVDAFRNNQPNPNIRLIVEATCDSERTEWGCDRIDTMDRAHAALLARVIQKNRRRTHWNSSVFQFESDRTNPSYNHFNFTWDAADPWDEMVGWDFLLSGLRNRFSDTVASLFRKVHSRRNAIAAKGEQLIREGGGQLNPSDFPDPILPFKKAFSQLLAPKELLDPEPREQTLYYTYQGNKFPVTSLSSGEREVVNIAFDFLLRNPSDCIVVFDEPELHLHPELSYKLLHTLRNSGERNQFIFVTHSPDIITASIEHSVVFVSPPSPHRSNQAVVVREDDATHEALELIGQSIGIVSLGRRIVLIEGATTSLDKQTYGAILKNRFPNLVLVPSGGRGLIQSFGTVLDNVLSKALWGVDFFMLCDRDAIPLGASSFHIEAQSKGRLKFLKRYHLENYFLDEQVLATIFDEWEPDGSWLRNPVTIAEHLKQLAAETVPYATALLVSAERREMIGNLDIMAKGCHGKSVDELVPLILDRVDAETTRFTAGIAASVVEEAVRTTHARLLASIEDGSWKYHIPGKAILERFAALAKVPSSRLKLRFLAEAERFSPNPFADVLEIFQYFSESQSIVSTPLPEA